MTRADGIAVETDDRQIARSLEAPGAAINDRLRQADAPYALASIEIHRFDALDGLTIFVHDLIGGLQRPQDLQRVSGDPRRVSPPRGSGTVLTYIVDQVDNHLSTTGADGSAIDFSTAEISDTYERAVNGRREGALCRNALVLDANDPVGGTDVGLVQALLGWGGGSLDVYADIQFAGLRGRRLEVSCMAHRVARGISPAWRLAGALSHARSFSSRPGLTR